VAGANAALRLATLRIMQKVNSGIIVINSVWPKSFNEIKSGAAVTSALSTSCAFISDELIKSICMYGAVQLESNARLKRTPGHCVCLCEREKEQTNASRNCN